MSYQALYRKYRPQTFEEVVGQTHIVRTLQNAIARDRIAHAYLFSGPRGTGKTSIAKIFARTLNCTGEHKPCGECSSCQSALQGNNPDIIEIDAASNNGVDEVRNLIDLVNYPPINGKYKIYIIDEVHMMTTGAFNALLKTIEEPPEYAIFIFATTEPHKVLPTILSRCQRFDFEKVTEKDISGRLQQVCESENIFWNQDGLDLIAMLADGGMRDSLSILDQCIAYHPEEVNAEAVREIYGLITENDLGEMFSLLNPEHAQEAIEKLNQFASQGMDLKRFLSDFISILKNSLLMDFSRTTDLVPDRQKSAILKYFLPSDSTKRIRLLEDLMETFNKLSYASNILDYIETSLLKNSYGNVTNQNQTSYENQNQTRNSEAVKPATITPKSDIPKNTPNIRRKHTISDQFWKSDVSRETFSSVSQPSDRFTLDNEFILSLLRGASKDQKASDQVKFQSLPIYESELHLAKFAASLRKAAILASAKTYILVQVPSRVEANQINEFQKTEGYSHLTEAMTGQPKAVFAVPNKQAKEAVSLFRERMKSNSLPEPYIYQPQPSDQNPMESDEPETVIQQFFPEVTILSD